MGIDDFLDDDDKEVKEDFTGKKVIIIGKIGNKVPRVFSDSIEALATGDWELRKLLKFFSDDPNNKVFYYGRAVWDDRVALNYFKNPVTYIDCAKFEIEFFNKIPVNEFHIVLGPHSGYNGALHTVLKDDGDTYKTLESTKRYCMPISKLMNKFCDASKFMYLSDRRYRLKSFDILNPPKVNLAQSISPVTERIKVLPSRGTERIYSFDEMKEQDIVILPFRFETLFLFEKSYDEYKTNCFGFTKKQSIVVIAANQVVSDKFISKSRFEQIEQFRTGLSNYCIVGKWTEPSVISKWKSELGIKAILDGLNGEDYFRLLKLSKYSLITFNIKDAPKVYTDNWITVKYFESMFNGCLTFIERFNSYNALIPQELQVRNGKELQEKIDRCESDPIYVDHLYSLQHQIMLPEYFDGTYFKTEIEKIRKEYY